MRENNDNDDRAFLEQMRNFHLRLSRRERINARLSYIMTAGTTAIAGTGVYITVDSDRVMGLLVFGLGGYATVQGADIAKTMLRLSRENRQTADRISRRLQQKGMEADNETPDDQSGFEE